MNAVVRHTENLPVAAARERILSFEQLLSQAVDVTPAEQRMEFENRHDFYPGLYARTLFLRAGTVCTGKIHKTRHCFVIAQGAATVVDSLGNRRLLVAPYMGTTEPGIKRAVYVHEDTIWTTFHPTELTDLAEIERALIAESFDAFDQENAV